MELRIDGRKVEAEPGMTILQAARRAGIHIPTLCHHEALSPYGACRVCLVELRREGRSRIVTACNYPVEEAEGAEVLTASERVLRNRRMVVELLLARCPGVEAVRRLAAELGVEEPRFKPDQEDCILCGLCTRVCHEVMGVGAIDFVSRGIDERVDTPFHKPSEVCIGCGACAAVCPAGCITVEDRDGMRYIERWGVALPMRRCRICGRAFATERHLQYLRDRYRISEDLLEVCPDCKREFYAEKLAAVAM